MKLATIALILAVPALAVAENNRLQDTSNMKTNVSAMFDKCDTNQDGNISQEEFNKETMDKFSKYDANQDGRLSKEEHAQMATEMHQKLMSGQQS